MNQPVSTSIYTPARRATRTAAWPSLAQLWSIATIALLALRVQLTPIAPNDFWWHAATGRIIVQTGYVPTVDQFSYTQFGQPYANQPWLAQIFMYLGLQIGGAALLEFVQALLIGASYGLLYRLCRREGAGPRIATLATLVGALIAMDNWQIRPQTYAVPLFIGTLSILWAWRRGDHARLWLLPLIMLIWVNLHGTFTLLIALCGAVWLGAVVERLWFAGKRSWRDCTKLALWSAAALAAALVNPRGIGVVDYVIGLLGNRAVSQLVTEWGSPWQLINEPMSMIFFVLLALFAALCAWRRRRLAITDILVALPFTVLALQSVRNILWFGIVATPLVAKLLMSAPKPARKRVEVALMNRLIAGLLALLLIATLPWWKEAWGITPKLGDLLSQDTPVAATAQLHALGERPQRVFADIGFASYLTWAAPEQRVFADPRMELYPYEQWQDYITIGQGKELDRLTAKYAIDGWLVSPTLQTDLVNALDRHPRWRRVFATDEAIYYSLR